MGMLSLIPFMVIGRRVADLVMGNWTNNNNTDGHQTAAFALYLEPLYIKKISSSML